MESAASEFKKSLRLHTRQAGFGSLRDLEDRTGLAHTTVSHAFNLGRDLPSERTVYIIVQATKGDQQFWGRQLELAIAQETAAAATRTDDDEPPEGDDAVTPEVLVDDVAEHGRPFKRFVTRAAVGLVAILLVILVVVFFAYRGEVSSPRQDQPVSSVTPPSTLPADGLFDETVIPDNSVRTISDPLTGGGLGVYIEAGQTVQVSCRVYSAVIPSALPDGYFYRVESSPWNGNFYASANSFLNGDPPGDPTLYVTATDLAVPVCRADG